MNTTRTLAISFLLLSSMALAAGCVGDDGNKVQDTDANSLGSDSRSAQTRTTGNALPRELSAAHILIMHRNSAKAPTNVTRSKEQALALAQEIAKKAKEPNADFAALAKEFSDGPSGARGGNLGVFPARGRGAMVKPFTDATVQLEIGEVSDLVETEYGYHIIRRQEIDGTR